MLRSEKEKGVIFYFGYNILLNVKFLKVDDETR